MELSKYILKLLQDIENRIDPETEDDFINQWKTFWNNKSNEIIFTPKRKKITAPTMELKKYTYKRRNRQSRRYACNAT